MANVVKHVVIIGRVQGVGFRFHTNRVAQELGVTGWVRNRSDGSVEAMVAGAPAPKKLAADPSLIKNRGQIPAGQVARVTT